MNPSSPVNTAEKELRNHPIGSPGRAWALYEVAKALLNRFLTHHSTEDLETARKLYLEAIENESDIAKKARYFGNLGIIYQYRYNQAGDVSDLDAFLDCTRQAADNISDELRPAALQNYANALQTQYFQRGDPRYLDTCIRTYQNALNLPGANRPKLCSNVCAALMTRYGVTKTQQDLDDACTFGQEAVSSTNDQYPMRALFLDSFGNALYARYQNSGSILDLDNSISHGQAAVALAEEQGLPQVPNFSVNLGGSLASRFKIYGTITDLDNALEMFSIAEDSMTPDHPSYEKLLFEKATALRMKFEETASEEDLALGIEVCTQAVNLELNDPHVRAQSEDALGNLLSRKYDLTGSSDVLDNAVKMYEEALLHTIPAATAAEIWHNLGTALQARFELRGSLEDLETSLAAVESGIQFSAKELPSHASSLAGFGTVLVRRFERLHLPGALDRAITAYKEALDMTPDLDRRRAGRLMGLGHALQIRFESTGSPTDFEDSVQYCQTSVDISQTYNKPVYYLSLVNLGNCFLRRAVRESSLCDLEDLNKAISNLQSAADQMPKDFSTRAACLNNLGKAYELRYDQTQMSDDLDSAARSYEVALELESGSPMLRVMAGYRGMLLTWSKNPPKAVEFLKEATKLLPFVSPRLLNRSDQQENIATFSGLASTGASILLETGSDAFEALQTLELSRGVMSSLLLDARIDTTELESHDPEVAKEFVTLRDQLDSSPSSFAKTSGAQVGLKLDIERRVAASKRFNELIDQIRSNDKTKRIFLAPSMEELHFQSESGAIVIINVSSIRSDALIVASKRIWHHRLPDLHEVDVLQQAQKYLSILEEDTLIGRKKTNKSLHSIFKWLWDAIISPILSELGIGGKSEEWPRIWWIPVGIMSVFPIHAAGEHSGKTGNNVLDQVISSYATTIRSLSHARRISNRLVSTNVTKAMFVAMSSTPNQTDLAFAKTEIDLLLSNTPENSVTKVVLRSPVFKNEVLKALQDCSIAHFSCHGIVDYLDPSNSTLLLSDWETNPLTVANINNLKLTNAQLAYLSACHASSNRVLRLLDEGIHFTGAFQMAGFPQAIGTLWQVDDQRSGLVSKMVWEKILDVDGKVDFGKAAEGLHHAVRALREQTRWVEGVEMRFPDQPIVWAPFIHMGI